MLTKKRCDSTICDWFYVGSQKEKVMKGSHSHRRPVALEGLPHMWESTKCQNNENSGREVAPYELYWRVKSGSHFYARMTTNVRLLAFILKDI